MQYLVREVGALQAEFPKLDWSSKQELSGHGQLRKSIAGVVEARGVNAPQGGDDKTRSRLGNSFNAMQVDPISLLDYGNSISAGPRLANNKAQFLSKGVYKPVEGYSPAVRGTLSLYQTIPRARRKPQQQQGRGGTGGEQIDDDTETGYQGGAAIAGRKLANGQFEEWSGRSVGGKAPNSRADGPSPADRPRERPATSMSLRDRLYAKMKVSPMVRANVAEGRGEARGFSRDDARHPRCASAPLYDAPDVNVSLGGPSCHVAHPLAAREDAGAGGQGEGGAGLRGTGSNSDAAKERRPHTAASSALSAASTAALDDVGDGVGGARATKTAVAGLKSTHKVAACVGSWATRGGRRGGGRSCCRCMWYYCNDAEEGSKGVVVPGSDRRTKWNEMQIAAGRLWRSSHKHKSLYHT